jgi:hypothetical protein
MRYFNRVYRLEVASNETILTLDGFPAKGKAPAQIRFTINQSPNAEHSIAEITIFGLRKERRQAIYQEFDTVRLVAGYAEAFGSIFSGEIRNVELGREGPESIVKLFCVSSARKWESAYINRSFGAGTPQIDIIRAVALTLASQVEVIGDFSALPKAIKGRTLSQDSKSAMRELAQSFEFEWMSENDRIILVKNGSVRTDSDIHSYTPITGLIGSPSVTQKGIDIEVLMNPFIRPWDQFECKSTNAKLTFNGVYYQSPIQVTAKGIHHVVSLTHDGDFYGDTWRTKIEGVKPLVV